MKKKKILFSVFLCLLCFGAQAQEDVLQIVPKEIAIDSNVKILEISMNNTNPYLALQFNIYFPEGISLRSGTKPYGNLPKDRFPYTEDYDPVEDVTTTTFNHAVQFATHEGYTTFVISPNDLSYIKGNSGTILRIYVMTDVNMTPGLYPIKFSNVVFTKYENNKMVSVNPPDVSTYVIVGSPQIGTKVDFSCLTGYMPVDVCAATNTWLTDKTDVTEVDLSNIDNAGKAIEAPNPNTLFYTKLGSLYADKQSAAEPANVVKGNICASFALTDGYPTYVTKEFTATNASYKRTVPATGWYSLCLPFATTVPNGISAEKFSSIDESKSSVTFNSTSALAANTPYIFNTSCTNIEFTATDAVVATTPSSITDNVFIGTYKKINAGSIEGCYALYADGSGFGIANATAYADPFRAYVQTSSNAKKIDIIHDHATPIMDTVITGCLSMHTDDDCIIFGANNTDQNVCISTLDGRIIQRFNIKSGESRTVGLPSGIYIINKTKIVVK